MSVKAMGWAYDQVGLKPVTKAVLVAIGNIADEEGYCWPSVKRIARMVEISVRSAQRHIQELEASGYLAVERDREREGGARTSNAYRLPMGARQLPLLENAATPHDKLTGGGDSPDRGVVTKLCQGAPDNCVTTYEHSLERSLEHPEGRGAPFALTGAKVKIANGHPISMKTFFERCREAGEDPIPVTDPVFAYAERAHIPIDFVHLAWVEFRRKYAEGGKKYLDWRAAFRKCVEACGYGLWMVSSSSGGYELTSKGKQAQKANAK